jgi:hypothetical protein
MVTDAKRLAQHERTVGRERVEATGRRLILPLLGAGGGLALGAAGLQLMLAAPVVPRARRRARRRIDRLSLTYLLGAAALLAWAVPWCVREVSSALGRTRREMQETVAELDRSLGS